MNIGWYGSTKGFIKFFHFRNIFSSDAMMLFFKVIGFFFVANKTMVGFPKFRVLTFNNWLSI